MSPPDNHDPARQFSADEAPPPARQPRRSSRKDLPAPFALLDLDALDRMTPPTWLLGGMVPENSLTLLYGPPRSFKSFAALAWALSIAYGLPWFGREVLQGAVLYVAGEGAAGLKKRVAAWRAELGTEDASAPFAVLPSAVNMTDPAGEDVQRLLITLDGFARLVQQPVRLVVLDTLARCLGGADENEAKAMGGFVQAADLIRERTGAAVLIVHHSGKDRDRGPRGSSSLFGAVDAAFECERDPAVPLMALRTVKQKDAEEAAPMTLKAETMPDEASGSLVLRMADIEAAGVARRPALPARARMAMEILADTAARQGTAAPAGLHDRIPAAAVVVTVAAWREAFYARTVDDEKPDTKRKAFLRAVETLQRAGLVGVWKDYAWLTKGDDN